MQNGELTSTLVLDTWETNLVRKADFERQERKRKQTELEEKERNEGIIKEKKKERRAFSANTSAVCVVIDVR
eukprot:1395044-Amorphochlora_amoeboformis.AAC.1